MPSAWPSIAERLLGAQRTPFPVSAAHPIRPDLFKLNAHSTREATSAQHEARAPARDGLPPEDDATGLLRADRTAPRYLAEKLERLDDPVRPLVLFAPDRDRAACLEAVRAAIDTLAAAHPELVVAGATRAAGVEFALSGIGLVPDDRGRIGVRAWRDDARELAARISSLAQPQRSLAALALSVQEDFALMALTPEGLIAEALSVAFASGWDPMRKIGRSLFEIHEPVADGEALRAASDNLARAMVGKGPFLRYVWTISDSDSLARAPGQRVGASAIDALWFRCERQVTVPLAAHGRSLFLIRVYVAPLTELAHDTGRRERIARALGAMSDDLLRYKGLQEVRELIVGEWG